MNTCENCLHHDLCAELSKAEDMCAHFNDASKFVEFPCSVGDEVYEIIEPGLFVKRKAYNLYSLVDIFYKLNHTVFLTREEVEKKIAGGAK